MENYSPLRYPGGKSALYPAIANIIESNNMKHCIYIEPFAGGANIAWSLLINGIVDYIIINDADKSIYSFWRAITESTHWFIEKIESVSVTVDEWRKQRAILQESSRYSKELGFAMFFLNRTNRSGILDAGPIGGYDQSGTYKIDCRFNKASLIKKISKIAEYKKNVKIYNQDISVFLLHYLPRWSDKGEIFIYFDPPYYEKGQRLYMNYLSGEDHERLRDAVPLSIKLTETSGTSSARTYTVKVFCTRSGKEWQVATTTTMTIPAGSTVATKNVNITFSHAGTFTTRVAVYNGSALLVTRSGANPDVSYGNWKITVTFDPDRLKYGSFSLYNAAGEQQVYGSALGRGENNLPENQQHGNTPCGTYSGILAGPHKNTDSFGPNKYIQTHAIDVPAIQKYGRTDAMWIHGGRSQTVLQWTDGCVRVFDSSMLSMQNSITEMTRAANGHYQTGSVVYRES